MITASTTASPTNSDTLHVLAVSAIETAAGERPPSLLPIRTYSTTTSPVLQQHTAEHKSQLQVFVTCSQFSGQRIYSLFADDTLNIGWGHREYSYPPSRQELQGKGRCSRAGRDSSVWCALLIASNTANSLVRSNFQHTEYSSTYLYSTHVELLKNAAELGFCGLLSSESRGSWVATEVPDATRRVWHLRGLTDSQKMEEGTWQCAAALIPPLHRLC